MGEKVKKCMDFSDEDDYLELKAEATKNRQNIGDFIISVFKFWKDHQKS
ncbi:MAG: hypothetical protein ACFFB3_12160 [Candidatus Hodarchaeota archaeon]